MSQMFYAVLAGERGKKAAANAESAWAWKEEAEKNGKAAQQWQQSATQWKEHSMALRSRIVEWQKSAIENEAISRAKSVMYEREVGQPTANYLVTPEGQQLISVMKEEVISEWGVNPWNQEQK